MSLFAVTNLTSDTLHFASGRFLRPHATTYVSEIPADFGQARAAGLVFIVDTAGGGAGGPETDPTVIAPLTSIMGTATGFLGKGAGVSAVTAGDLGSVFSVGGAEPGFLSVVSMTGATAGSAGARGLVPAPTSGQQTLFLRGDGTWAAAGGAGTTMTGATAGAAGTGGLTPAPAAGQQGLFLRGDATWAAATAAVMTGATALSAGAAGSVPAPVAGDNVKFLRGDGTWQAIASGGAPVRRVLTVSNAGIVATVTIKAFGPIADLNLVNVNVLAGNSITMTNFGTCQFHSAQIYMPAGFNTTTQFSFGVEDLVSASIDEVIPPTLIGYNGAQQIQGQTAITTTFSGGIVTQTKTAVTVGAQRWTLRA